VLSFPCAFFFCRELREFHRPFPPRFLASLSLGASYKLQQTTGAAAELDVIAGREFFTIRNETVWLVRVEDQLPLQAFLPRQDERYRLVMCVNQQQKRVVMNGFAFEGDNIGGVSA